MTARSITVAAAQLGPIQQAEPRAVVVERMQRLDDFWSPRLAVSRQGTRWLNVLKTLVTYRLITRVVRRLYRQWYEQSAMADLLGEDFALVHKDNLYRCLDKLLAVTSGMNLHEGHRLEFAYDTASACRPDPIERAAVLRPIKAKPFGWPRKTRPALTGRALGGREI